jgi:hypothetical protein
VEMLGSAKQTELIWWKKGYSLQQTQDCICRYMYFLYYWKIWVQILNCLHGPELIYVHWASMAF